MKASRLFGQAIGKGKRSLYSNKQCDVHFLSKAPPTLTMNTACRPSMVRLVEQRREEHMKIIEGDL